jgi:periplasmic divalent cation tolerance protein
MSDSSVCLLLTTCPDAATAQALADGLVGARLAACVSQLPGMISTYRWQGQIQRETEIQLVIKTSNARRDEAMAHIQTHHPYAVPEILALAVSDGLPAYLAWVLQNTAEDC